MRTHIGPRHTYIGDEDTYMCVTHILGLPYSVHPRLRSRVALVARATYVSSYCYICVLILLYMCPHTAIYVSSYCYICVLILRSRVAYVARATYVLHMSYICVLILIYMCPHTAIYVSSYYYICVSYCYICVLILLSRVALVARATYVSSYCYTCVLILIYMCPHNAICVS
jgi:hypothetical protein